MIRNNNEIDFYGLPVAFLKEQPLSSLNLSKEDISYQDNLQTFVNFQFNSFLFDLVKEKNTITIYSQYALPMDLYHSIVLAFSNILKIDPHLFSLFLGQDTVLSQFIPTQELLTKLIHFLNNPSEHTKKNTLLLSKNPQYLSMSKYGDVILKNEPNYD